MARAGALLLGIVLLGLKLEALYDLLHAGRLWLLVCFGLGALHAFRRGRPLTCASGLAVITALVIRPHPWTTGVLVGVVVFAGLGALCFLIGQVARALDGDDPDLGRGWLG